MSKCLLLRGLPGAGKTTLAKRLFLAQSDYHIGKRGPISADDFFTSIDNRYNFDAVKLGEAHLYCAKTFYNALLHKEALVIVHNTFIQAHDIAFYYELAEGIFGYDTEIITIECTPEQSLARNIHSVPEKTIANMTKALAYAQLPKRWKHRKIVNIDAY